MKVLRLWTFSPDGVTGHKIEKAAWTRYNRSMKERKRTAISQEHFTPLELIKEIHDHFPPGAIESSIVQDKTCGDGAFLIDALQRKLASGLSDSVALSQLRGLDILPDNIEQCHQNLLALTDDTEENRALLARYIVCVPSSLSYDYSFPKEPALEMPQPVFEEKKTRIKHKKTSSDLSQLEM